MTLVKRTSALVSAAFGAERFATIKIKCKRNNWKDRLKGRRMRMYGAMMQKIVTIHKKANYKAWLIARTRGIRMSGLKCFMAS